ncbi:MAG TPA: pyrroline-5-carboxylate reductase [Hyphomicrobiaceae bacterium]|jgi:pyrroline-5-carboxylate reductase|nr:pyrroline-5-carboxylate reductase [Hyphomicrobiaceae bacterium]
MTLKTDGPLVLAGAGNMGAALLAGWLQRGLDPSAVLIQDPSPPPASLALLERHGLRASARLDAAAAPAVIVVAVKPQIMDEVFPALARHAGPRTVVLSIAAGRTLAGFERHLEPSAAVVRAMPNTPAAIARGITVAVANAHVSPAQRQLCDALLRAVGEVEWVDEEGLLDPVTAVSGSGPAYVFYLAECLAAAGVKAGLTPELAMKLARHTVAGAGELIARSGAAPAALRESVTSPNGTTFAALKVLMGQDGLERLLGEAVAAATRRSRELAK